MASTAFKMDGVDWQKVKVGAGVAFGGAFLAFIPMFMSGVTYKVGNVDLTPFVVFGLSVAVNIIRKWVTDHSQS